MRIPTGRILTCALLLPAAMMLAGAAMAQESKEEGKPAPSRGGEASRMVIERRAEGAERSASARTAAAAVSTEAKEPKVTLRTLQNGLVEARVPGGFMTTITATKSADGTISYQCSDPTHPKGAHSHEAASAPARKGAEQ